MVFVWFLLSFPIFIGMEIEKKFFVYVDYRKDDGKPFYVGKGAEKRIKNLHRNPLHTNIKKKHGMVRRILFENLSENESFEREIQLIQELQTHIDHGNGGANLTLGGEGVSGYKHTDEQKKKHSDLVKKLYEDPEYREKMKKLYEDPEYREKISESSKKLWEDPEHRAKMSESRKKMWEDPVFKEKMSESHKKKWENPEIQKKHRESIKKKWEDPEFREKMSESVKKQWEDPEYRKKMNESRKLGRSKLTPEQRSEKIRKGWETRRLKKLQLSSDPLHEVIPQ